MNTHSSARNGTARNEGAALTLALVAEAAGTFILVFAVLGAAIFGADFDDGKDGLNIGFVGVALALGLSVFVGGAALGSASGAHFNPAVSVGLAVAGRFGWRKVGPYVVAQTIGAILGSTAIAGVAAGGGRQYLADAVADGFAGTGWGKLSPGGFTLWSALLIEVIATAVFLTVVLRVTEAPDDSAVSPLAVGLTLTLVALVAIPVSNGSFNPARSIASAVWGGALVQSQLWLSLVAPVAGAAVAGALYRCISAVSAGGMGTNGRSSGAGPRG